MYIVDSEQIEKIYNQIKNLEIYSFEGETIIDPAYDIGDILIIDGKPIIYQGEIEYATKFKANIKSKIQPKTANESMQTKEDTKAKIRRIQSNINQITGEITQLTQETSEHEETLIKHEQDLNGIKQSVENTIDYKRKQCGINQLKLIDCQPTDLMKFNICGVKEYNNYLFPQEDLFPSDIFPNSEVI